MTYANDRRLIQISAESRALVRAAITRHPGWKDYRETHDVDLSDLTTRDAIFDACDALGIDVAATIAAGVQPAEDKPRERAPRQPRVAANLFEPTQEPAAPAAPVSAPAPAAIHPAPADAAAQLLGLIAGLAPKAGLDEARVAELVGQFIAERVDPTLDHIGAAVAELINQQAPAIRIELRRGDEIAVVPGHHHPKFPTLLKALAARQGDGYAPNIWISGPAGSGKTHAAKTAASALAVPFHYNGALSMPHELLGFIDAAGHYHRTPFREAYEHGGVYLFDEIDASDNSALLALSGALANGLATFPDGHVRRHADCYIVGTANTWGLGATADYVGRSKIDAMVLSRFPVRLAWDYDEPLERAISGNEGFARKVQAARAKARAAGLKVLVDPRATIAGAALVAQGFSADEAAELTYLANLTADQRRMIGG